MLPCQSLAASSKKRINTKRKEFAPLANYVLLEKILFSPIFLLRRKSQKHFVFVSGVIVASFRCTIVRLCCNVETTSLRCCMLAGSEFVPITKYIQRLKATRYIFRYFTLVIPYNDNLTGMKPSLKRLQLNRTVYLI